MGIGIWNLFGNCPAPLFYKFKVCGIPRWREIFGFWIFTFLLPFLVRAQGSGAIFIECLNEDLCHPLRRSFNIIEFLGKTLQTILGLVGVIAFVMVVFGAIRWMTAGGNSENVDKGRSMMVWAFLGLALAASSFVILDFIFKGLNTALYQP